MACKSKIQTGNQKQKKRIKGRFERDDKSLKKITNTDNKRQQTTKRHKFFSSLKISEEKKKNSEKKQFFCLFVLECF